MGAGQERRRVVGAIADATVAAVGVVDPPRRAGADRAAAPVRHQVRNGQTGTPAASDAGSRRARRLAGVGHDGQTWTTDAGASGRVGSVGRRRQRRSRQPRSAAAGRAAKDRAVFLLAQRVHSRRTAAGRRRRRVASRGG